MRILGIDYGDARTGIAITDALKITAQGLETIHNEGSDKVILRRLDEIIEQYDVDTLVVGKPINMNGTLSERTGSEVVHVMGKKIVLYRQSKKNPKIDLDKK